MVSNVQLVGVLNVTPDSFSDGGKFMEPEAALAQAAQLFADGASLIDVGAESTRPHAQTLTPAEEWDRLELVLPELVKRYPGKLSLDTYHPETAGRALDYGELIINDVTGLNNPAMVEMVVRLGARCIVSHLPAREVQTAHEQEPVSDIAVVRDDLLAKLSMLEGRGVPAERIILDPGIGFGKTMELNRQLLEFAKYVPGQAVMIGYSRKRFLGEHRMELEPNLAAGRIAIAAGAAYLRVHDVAGHRVLLGA
jgi:dihydropteroate synthase